MLQYEEYAHLYDHWTDKPGYPLARDFSHEEYRLRVKRARELMTGAGLDALVITSSAVGEWFTSRLEPHEWHDLCPARIALYVLTDRDDRLFMTPTAGGEHMNTTRRSTWVSAIGAIVERTQPPRVELWDLDQLPQILTGLGLEKARIGFELGDCMTLGMAVNDFLRLRELMPQADLTDGSAVIRQLMSVHTPEEIRRVRLACEAGTWIHQQVPHLLRCGQTERELLELLANRFGARWGHPADGYEYEPAGIWDVRNSSRDDSPMFHATATDRPYVEGDLLFRGWSGVRYRGYPADIDRLWYLGKPPKVVLDLYRVTWECNQAMAQAVGPGESCAAVYAAGARVEKANGLPVRSTGRTGHGLRNSGGLSVHPANQTVLEPGMIISVEPMFATEYGFFDLEDQYLVTETGAEVLHTPAPEHLPTVSP